MADYDFCGWASKNDILCDDGRIIRKNAFKEMDGLTVPLVYNHDHKNLGNVLGHATLENRDDGVYCYGHINRDSEAGKQALSLLKDGSIRSLSIYANKLKQVGHDVIHGVIREVSLVLSGANRGALIDTVMAHSADFYDEDGEGVIIFNGEENPLIHDGLEDEDDNVDDENEIDAEEAEEIMDSMTEKQKRFMLMMMGMAASDAAKEVSHSADDSDDDDEEEFSLVDAVMHGMSDEDLDDDDDDDDDDDEFENEEFDEDSNVSESSDNSEEDFSIVDAVMQSGLDDFDDDDDDDDDEFKVTNQNNEEENNDMTHNMFENEVQGDVLIQSAAMCKECVEDAMKYGSLKESFMAHSGDYGIDNIDYLFPDAKNYTDKPEFIKRRTEWVNAVLSGVRQSPFSRVKSIFADITEDEARAKGYIKGNRKPDEVFTLLKRETTPTTIIKKQKIDRDDIIDITDFSVIDYIKQEMRIMYDEEVARAILVGDGRNPLNPDKIKEANVRPIWTDDDLFTVKKAIAVTTSTTDQAKAKALIKNIIKSRKLYRGSGNPTLFIAEDLLSDMLLIEDTTGRLIYDDISKLKNTLRVKDIVEVPIFDGLSRIDGGDTKFLAAILVNLNDYRTGKDKGGALSFFDDFDIDFNQNKYLMESRFSGALVIPYSAIVYEFVYNLTLDIQAKDSAAIVLGKTVSELQENVYVNDNSIQGVLNYVTGWTAFDPDHEENQSGHYVALQFEASDGAVVKFQTIGGLNDERIVQLDSDMDAVIYVKSNKEKIRVTCELNGDTINRTLSFSGLKLLQ